MKNRVMSIMTTMVCACLLACAASYSGQAGNLQSAQTVLAHELISAWEPQAALELIKKGLKSDPDSTELLFLKARAYYYLSRYDAAAEVLNSAATADPRVAVFKDLLAAICKTTDRFVSRESEHFVMRAVPGKDEVLYTQGLAALEQAYAALEKDLGYRPENKVVVEVYPDTESFILASTLSPAEVRTSGTIALCKFNRIMIVSPRTLLTGYPWLDTLCHEYVHYVLWKKNGDTVPIWLHEGIAKFQEKRWKGEGGTALTPYMRTALKTHLASGTLLPLDRMHPSFAKLESREEVVLASAEVLSLIRFIWIQGGYDAILGILDHLRTGKDYRDALAVVWEMSFDDFMQSWKKQIAGLAPGGAPGLAAHERTFVDLEEKSENGSSEQDREIDRLPSPKVKDFVRLAALLEERGRGKAAILELEKALEQGGRGSPMIANRLAALYLSANKTNHAQKLLQEALTWDEEYVTTLENLGRVYKHTGRDSKAVETLVEATRINPFNPYTRQDLFEVYSKLGWNEDAMREGEALAILTGEGIPQATEQEGR
ncbi:tetratricopeptide repeat protein [Acidobacteriota bacterium]